MFRTAYLLTGDYGLAADCCSPIDGECTVVAEDVDKFSKVILAGETYAGL